MKVVLAGGYDTANLGDHAMLVVLRRQLEEEFGDVEIVLLSRHPDAEFDRRYGVRSIPNLDHESAAQARGRFFRGLNLGDDREHLERIAEELRSADLLVLGGGRMFIDIAWGVMRGPLAYFAQLQALARFVGTPVFVYAKTIVPVERDDARETLRFLCGTADLVTVRDEASLAELKRAGVERDDVHVLPDPAFALGAAFALGPVPAAPQTGVRPRLAVNLRSYAWRDGQQAEEERRAALAALLDRVVEELGARLVFVPQTTYAVDTPETDDRHAARCTVERMARSSECELIEGAPSVEDALALYAGCDLLLGMRRHGAIFAATQGTPVVGLAAESNAERALADLELSGGGSDPETVVRSAREVLAQGAAAREAVRQRCEVLAAAAGQYGRLVRTLL